MSPAYNGRAESWSCAIPRSDRLAANKTADTPASHFRLPIYSTKLCVHRRRHQCQPARATLRDTARTNAQPWRSNNAACVIGLSLNWYDGQTLAEPVLTSRQEHVKRHERSRMHVAAPLLLYSSDVSRHT
jgi:hypothetical protein